MAEASADTTVTEDFASLTVTGEFDPLLQNDNAQEAAPETIYLEGFDAPNASVVLMGTDGVGLRVHDYYLKAASPFFRDLLEAGTTGGPIPLEATSLQLQFIMDKVVGRTPKKRTLRAIAQNAPKEAIQRGYEKLWSLAELDGIASKYLFEDVSKYIRDIIADIASDHAPFALAFACQDSPPHVSIVQEALHAFENKMPIWMDAYFTRPLPLTDDYLSPAAPNLTKSFARDLGAEGVLAYLKALELNGEPVEEVGVRGWNWTSVARSFIREMDLEGQWNLMDGHDTDSESGSEVDSDADIREGEESAAEESEDDEA